MLGFVLCMYMSLYACIHVFVVVCNVGVNVYISSNRVLKMMMRRMRLLMKMKNEDEFVLRVDRSKKSMFKM